MSKTWTRTAWQRHLRRAGLPDYLTPRAIGREQIKGLAHLQTSDPKTYAMMAKAHLQSTVDFLLRLPEPHGRAYLAELVAEDPALYRPLLRT
jgi:hypothetical protein